MPKIVVLGSCRFEPYTFLAVPNKIPNAWNTEKGYKIACEKFYPAIKDCDEVWVYVPEGIGKHTQRDIVYAQKHNKKIRFINTLYKTDREKWLKSKQMSVEEILNILRDTDYMKYSFITHDREVDEVAIAEAISKRIRGEK